MHKTILWKAAFVLSIMAVIALMSCGSSGGGNEDDDVEEPAPGLIPALSEELTDWDFKVDTAKGAIASISVTDRKAHIVVEHGGTLSPDVMLSMKEPISLTRGHMYTLSYKVTGTPNRTVMVSLEENGVDVDGDDYEYTDLQNANISCTGDEQTITRSFKVDELDEHITLNFYLGSYGGNGTNNNGSDFILSDITLKDIGPAPALTEPEMLLNGNFENGSLNWIITQMWNESIRANVSFDGGTLAAEVIDSGTEYWSIAARSIDWISVEEGIQYELKFSCKGKKDKSLMVTVQEEGIDDDGDSNKYTQYYYQQVVLDGTDQDNTFTFTAPANNSKICVKFGLGSFPDAYNNDGLEVTIDNVSLMPYVDTSTD